MDRVRSSDRHHPAACPVISSPGALEGPFRPAPRPLPRPLWGSIRRVRGQLRPSRGPFPAGPPPRTGRRAVIRPAGARGPSPAHGLHGGCGPSPPSRFGTWPGQRSPRSERARGAPALSPESPFQFRVSGSSPTGERTRTGPPERHPLVGSAWSTSFPLRVLRTPGRDLRRGCARSGVGSSRPTPGAGPAPGEPAQQSPCGRIAGSAGMGAREWLRPDSRPGLGLASR